MASRKVKLRIDTELQKKALDDAVKGIRKVDQAMEKSAKTSTKMGAAGVKANKANSWAAGQAAMQLQDVSVQAQMGTDSMRILGQQGPQLLSAFGPTGMLAGLAVAVGAGLVSAFRKPKEEIGDLIEEMDGLSSHLEDLEQTQLDSMVSSMEHLTRRTHQAAEAFSAMAAAQDEAESRSQSAADAFARAILKRREMMGENVDLEKAQLAASEKAQAIQKKREKSNTAIAKQLWDQRQEVEKLTAALAAQEEQVSLGRGKVASARERRDVALEEQAEALGSVKAGWGPRMRKPSKKSEKRLEKAAELMSASDAELDELNSSLQGFRQTANETEGKLRDAERALAETQSKLPEGLAQIDGTAISEAFNAQADSVEKQLSILEDAMRAGMDAIGGAAPSDVVARIKAILEGGIKVDELDDIVTATKMLGVNLNRSFGENNKTLKEVIGQLEARRAEFLTISNRLSTVEQKLKTPPR